jgi:hypothetical protein
MTHHHLARKIDPNPGGPRRRRRNIDVETPSVCRDDGIDEVQTQAEPHRALVPDERERLARLDGGFEERDRGAILPDGAAASQVACRPQLVPEPRQNARTAIEHLECDEAFLFER